MWDLIIAAVWLLFLTRWFAAYAYARQPKQGTLEWIQMYDRPSFTCLGDRGKLEKRDIWWLLGCLVLSAAYACYALWISKNALDAGAVSNDWYHLQIMDFAPVVAAVATYLLCRMLKIRGLTALFTALSTATCYETWGCVLLALVCFYGWMSQKADAPLWKNGLWLLGCGVLLCLPWSGLTPLWLLPVMGICWLVVLILRWRADMTVGRLVAMVLLSVLGLAVCLLVMVIEEGLLLRQLAWSDLPYGIWNGSLLPVLDSIRDGLINPLYQQDNLQYVAPWYVVRDYGIKLAGLFAVVTLLVEAITRRNIRAAWLVLLAIGAALLFVFATSGILTPVLAMAIALVSQLMWEREKKTAAVLLPALTLAMQLQECFNVGYFLGL